MKLSFNDWKGAGTVTLALFAGVFLVGMPELSAQQSAAFGHDPVWVPKAVQVGILASDGTVQFFSPVNTPGSDYDGDGYHDLFFASDFLTIDHVTKKSRGILFGRGLRIKWVDLPKKVLKVPFVYETLLQRGGNLEQLIIPFKISPDSFFPLHWTFPSLDFLGSIYLPPSSWPWRLGPFFRSPIPVGDLDGDGYQELLGWTSGWRADVLPRVWGWAYSLLDGKTLTLRWQHLIPNGQTGFSLHSPIHRPVGDVDGDGVLDVTVLVLQDNPERSSVRLLSGADGHAIWDQRAFPEPQRFTQVLADEVVLEDLDGDGFREVLAYAIGTPELEVPGFLTALSGKTGKPVWKRYLGMDFPNWGEFPAKRGARPLLLVGSAGDVDEDGVADFLLETEEWKDDFNFVAAQWIFSGRNGDLLARESWPDDFLPWFTIRGSRNLPFEFVEFWLDDLDRDGWPEIGVSIPLHGTQTQRPTKNFLILGRRTLWTKPKARPGDVLEAHLWIPNGAGKTWRLFGSTGFRNDGTSLHAGVWDTHLAKEDLLHNQNGGLVLLSGPLDAAGKADFQLPVPADPTLSGQVLYFMAVVDDPAQPDGVLTLSTLAQVHVRP